MSKQSVVPTEWESNDSVVISSKPLTVLFANTRNDYECGAGCRGVVRFEGLDLDSLEAPTNGRVYVSAFSNHWNRHENLLNALLASYELGLNLWATGYGDDCRRRFEEERQSDPRWVTIHEAPKGTFVNQMGRGNWEPEDDPDEQGMVEIYSAQPKVMTPSEWLVDICGSTPRLLYGRASLMGGKSQTIHALLDFEKRYRNRLDWDREYFYNLDDYAKSEEEAKQLALRDFIKDSGWPDGPFRSLSDPYLDHEGEVFRREVDRLCKKHADLPSMLETIKEELRAAEEEASKK
jgi:hypothetical protein